MNEIKLQQCREHWQHLAPHVKERATAKHLLAAVTVGEYLLTENNKLETECRQLRLIVHKNDMAALRRTKRGLMKKIKSILGGANDGTQRRASDARSLK